MAFDNLVLNALNGTPLECISSGLSCTVFDGELKAQTQVETGAPGTCAFTFASQELDCTLVSKQHVHILPKLDCIVSVLFFCLLGQSRLNMYPAQDVYLSLSMQVRGF